MTALALFFAAGALIALSASVSLTAPGRLLEPMWRLNPHARTAMAGSESWAALLLAVVSAACACAAAGLWRGARWGHRLAVAILAVNVAGDTFNAVAGTEPRAAFGIPVALALLAYLLSRGVRGFFTSRAGV